MATFAMPAIDQNICAYWPEQSQDFYNRLPYYLDKAEASSRAKYETFEPLLTDTIDWKPNMGDTMKLVITEKPPVLRQTTRPNSIRVEAKGDIFNVRERTSTAQLVHQKFFSPKFRFLAAFQDFMKGQLMPTRSAIEEQIRVFKDVFYRTYMWDYAPVVYVAGYGPINAPVGVDASGNSLKTAAWIASCLNSLPNDGYLTYQELFNVSSCAVQERGMEPYSGGVTKGNGGATDLTDQFCLVTSYEGYAQFVNDAWVKENRPQLMNIVNDKFKPTPFGTIMARMERYPFRWSLDANNTPTEQAPETIITDANSAEYNRTIPNPAYAKLDGAVGTCSPIEVGWLLGKNGGFRRINTGAPPEMFAGSTSDPAKIAGMEWNGRVYATKNFPIQCTDSNGATQLDLNSFGEYLRFQAQLTLGCVSVNPQNVMPIIYRRRRGVTTTGLPGAGN